MILNSDSEGNSELVPCWEEYANANPDFYRETELLLDFIDQQMERAKRNTADPNKQRDS